MAMITEADWELAALEELVDLGWTIANGKDLNAERDSLAELALPRRAHDALAKLNPSVPAQYLKQAAEEILAVRSADAINENHRLHSILTKGYRGVSYLDDNGVEQAPTIRVISAKPHENDWLAVNQVRLQDREHDRRFDIVLYCNGLPIAIIELKRAASAADVSSAHAQLQTYLREFPAAFRFATLLVASDGRYAQYGTPFTPLNHFSPWNVNDDGEVLRLGDDAGGGETVDDELTTLLHGLFNLERFLQLQRDFTAFDNRKDEGLAKRIAKPHQYFAVTKAVGSTVDAVRGNGKAGVVWHTQGSGKSMEMELYAHRVATHPALHNPTIIVITDRNELDGQLFSAFERSQLLPSTPVQIQTRNQLRDTLTNANSGGIYFTTLQKFSKTQAEREAGHAHPLISDRRNIIVVVDEAHRSHYDDLDGYARHLKDALPHATLIAFTGTPISSTEKNTRDVFGDYVDVYDLSRAVEDGATVPVFFEPRLIKLGLGADVSTEDVDQTADEVTTGLDDVERERVERTVTTLNALYGTPDRIASLVDDLLNHWDGRAEQMSAFISSPDKQRRGKAMIVCATREICVRVYDQIVKVRPEWHDDADTKGKVKIVFSGVPSDPAHLQPHIRRPSAEKVVKERVRDEDDDLEFIIVKDMMLTGFDAPALHTLYLDRPMRGALLMQTLARVNRTYAGKPDGLLVAYAPLITENLEDALGEYTTDDQRKKPVGKQVEEAVRLAETLLSQLDSCLVGFDWRTVVNTPSPKARIKAVGGATNFLRSPTTKGNEADADEKLSARYRRLANQLARTWTLAQGATTFSQVQKRDALFYEEVRVWMAKADAAERIALQKPIPADVERLLGKLVDDSTESGEVLDIYAAAGMERMSLADLTPDRMRKLADNDQPHLALEKLRNMLLAEASKVTRGNLVRSRVFSERITELMTKYTNQQLTAAQVMAELFELSKEIVADADRGKKFDPPLADGELAVYDALGQNDSAVLLQGEDTLAQIARELVSVLRRDTRTDWTVRDDVRAKLRSSIRRLLVKYDYPPDKQAGAIVLVMEQLESMAPSYADELRRERDGDAT